MRLVSDMYVSPSARVTLTPQARLVGRIVTDTATGVTHALNPTAARALTLAARGMTFGELCDEVARRGRIDPSRARTDLLALFVHLDRYDLLLVTQPDVVTTALRTTGQTVRQPWMAAWSVIDRVTNPPRRRPAQRFSPTPLGVVTAVLRGQTPLFVTAAAGLAVLLGAATVLFAPPRNTTRFVEYAGNSGRIVGGVALLCALTVLHELGHLLVARRLRVTTLYVARRGMTVAVVHERAAAEDEAVIAAAGPLVAAAAALLTAVLLHAWRGEPIGYVPTVATLAVVLAALHLVVLGPWSEDGRAVWSWLIPRASADPARP